MNISSQPVRRSPPVVGLPVEATFYLIFVVLLFCGLTNSLTAKAADGEEQSFISQAELEQMLAPIALYPDAVLSHVLIASTYPLEIVLAHRWVEEHPDLTGDQAIQSVDEEWDPSVIALVAFPNLLARMSKDVSWTEQLGEAFLIDEARVLDSIQDLRRRAHDSGSLDDLEHAIVTQEETRIIIEPRVREVVYLPYYDTRVVYGPWWWAGYPPVYWYQPHHYHRPVSHVYWGPRVHLSFGFFFSSFHWSHHRVIVVDRHHWHHRPHYNRHTVIHHRHARTWHHDVRHRRGVHYRHHQVAKRYNVTHRGTVTQHDKVKRDRVHRNDMRGSRPAVSTSRQTDRQRHKTVVEQLSQERRVKEASRSSGDVTENNSRGKRSNPFQAVHPKTNEASRSGRGDASIYRGAPVGDKETLGQRKDRASRQQAAPRQLKEQSTQRQSSQRQSSPRQKSTLKQAEPQQRRAKRPTQRESNLQGRVER